jgi:hypothetical protein
MLMNRTKVTAKRKHNCSKRLHTSPAASAGIALRMQLLLCGCSYPYRCIYPITHISRNEALLLFLTKITHNFNYRP